MDSPSPAINNPDKVAKRPYEDGLDELYKGLLKLQDLDLLSCIVLRIPKYHRVVMRKATHIFNSITRLTEKEMGGIGIYAVSVQGLEGFFFPSSNMAHRHERFAPCGLDTTSARHRSYRLCSQVVRRVCGRGGYL